MEGATGCGWRPSPATSPGSRWTRSSTPRTRPSSAVAVSTAPFHAAAGPRLLEECRRLRRTTHPQGLGVGEAVATPGYDLPARWVIHTVGPNRHRGQTDPDLLASCFRRSLDVAAELPARTVAFPAVSAGVYGWPVEEVAAVAVASVRDWSDAMATGPVELVRFVLFGAAALAAFERALRRIPPSPR